MIVNKTEHPVLEFSATSISTRKRSKAFDSGMHLRY